MPEFQARHKLQLEWKKAVLNREIELEDIDTDPFNFAARGKPTKTSTREARNMVSGVSGRPDAVTVRPT